MAKGVIRRKEGTFVWYGRVVGNCLVKERGLADSGYMCLVWFALPEGGF